MDPLVKVFKAVGNDTRLSMLRLLFREGELPTEIIAKKLSIPRATTCRNLKILERVDLVKNRRWKVDVYYSINTTVIQDAHKILLDLIKEENKRLKS